MQLGSAGHYPPGLFWRPRSFRSVARRAATHKSSTTKAKHNRKSAPKRKPSIRVQTLFIASFPLGTTTSIMLSPVVSNPTESMTPSPFVSSGTPSATGSLSGVAP